MDYRDEIYPKMPFYMAYPIQNMYLTEMEYEKDLDRMKSLYPAETNTIMKMVEERLDELEFEGSRIYDEEPDRRMIQMEIDQLYQRVAEDPKILGDVAESVGNTQKQSYFEMVPMSITGNNLKAQGKDCRDNWLCSMVGVLFGTELYRRRCRHRRCRRWF